MLSGIRGLPPEDPVCVPGGVDTGQGRGQRHLPGSDLKWASSGENIKRGHTSAGAGGGKYGGVRPRPRSKRGTGPILIFEMTN